MCYIQWSIKAKSATTWTAAHTIFIISITFIHDECNATGNVPSAHPQHETSRLHKPADAGVPTNHGTCNFILMFMDPTHCPAAHCSAMTHNFNLNLLYLEVQNYGPYQAKDQTWLAINNIFCNNILQSNLKIIIDVIRVLHYISIINSLTTIFPTINSVPDIFISSCTYIYIYIYIYAVTYVYVCMYVCICLYVCNQAYVFCETKDTVTVENSELPVYTVKILKVLSNFQISSCSIQISYQLLTLYHLSLFYTGLRQKYINLKLIIRKNKHKIFL